MSERTLRVARPEDYEDVRAFTADTWIDRTIGDYIPEIYHDWVAADGEDQRTVVTEVDGTVVGICQAQLLTDEEAWLQGIRVHPDHRSQGHGQAMTVDLFEWCREQGAVVARNMVFGWNGAGMGQSRAVGFEPGITCRWARPAPEAADSSLAVRDDVASAWQFWTRSDAREHLDGLALASGNAWALQELTRDRLETLAADQRLFVVVEERTKAMALRLRTGRSHEDDVVADYAVGAWTDFQAADDLFAAIADDAATLGVDRTRVCIPNTPRYVSDAAFTRAGLSDEALYVFVADLTGE